jgi:hypothetical protein
MRSELIKFSVQDEDELTVLRMRREQIKFSVQDEGALAVLHCACAEN